jgi:hypothetical protein
MKHITSCFAFLIIVASVLSGCGKSGTSPSKPKGGTTTAMYPATSTFVQTGGTPITYQYKYDSDNNLTYFGSAGEYEVAVTAHTVAVSTFSSAYNFVTTYSYTGASNAPVDIYTDIPAQMSISMYSKDNNAGTSMTNPGKLWAFEGSKSAITKMFTSDAGGENIDFTYDANNNFKTISFTNLSGVQADIVVASMTVTGVDNHPSPYSAVKGYNTISYPQEFISDYAQAFCKNNPTQIIYRHFDYNKNDLEISEQDDFTYTYNDQGYPTTITVKVTYIGTQQSSITKTYTYTYK